VGEWVGVCDAYLPVPEAVAEPVEVDVAVAVFVAVAVPVRELVEV
jgi:hypothetical protein